MELFENNQTTHIVRGIIPESQVFGKKFAEATPFVLQVGLSDMSQFGESGRLVPRPVFPYRLTFRPSGEISFTDFYVRHFTEDLVSIPRGTTLYNVCIGQTCGNWRN